MKTSCEVDSDSVKGSTAFSVSNFVFFSEILLCCFVMGSLLFKRVFFEPENRKSIMKWKKRGTNVLIKGQDEALINLTIKPLLFIQRRRSPLELNSSHNSLLVFEQKSIFPWKARRNLKIYFSIWLFGFFFFFRLWDFFQSPLKVLASSLGAAQEIDTNTIELKSKRKEKGRRKYLKTKLLELVNPSLGKYSIKKLSKWIYFWYFFMEIHFSNPIEFSYVKRSENLIKGLSRNT